MTIFRTVSFGVRFMVVAALVLLMGIPAIFVSSLVEERSARAKQVEREVGFAAGGPQTFAGPLLAIPYSTSKGERGTYFISPTRFDAHVATVTELRHRSLFKVPVYQSDIALNASFDLTGSATVVSDSILEWSKAELVVGATDPKGAIADATLATAGATSTMVPSSAVETHLGEGEDALYFFGVPTGSDVHSGAKFDVAVKMKFSGAERIAVLATGKSSAVDARGDWPNPSFDGGFLPAKRAVSKDGFEAQWTVPFIARGVHAEGDIDLAKQLQRTSMGVSFVQLADPYQAVTRSVKYALLFIGLTFLTYFLFETRTGKRVHPAQYLLIGLAQIVFYLLLLSFAERIGFDWGFAVAAVATVALISNYAGWVFASRKQAVVAGVVFSCLYVLIYFLLRL
ncbi:MAG TPA: cell envelope integrity protein CreD, partial [Terriglobales bacterium]